MRRLAGWLALAAFGTAAGCGGLLPVHYEPPPPDSYDAAVYQVRIDDATHSVPGAAVSPAFFETPGVRPMLGRLFIEPEYTTSSSPVVLFAHAFWVERFDSSPAVIGQQVDVNGSPAVIVGVLPSGFSFPDGARLWVPRTAAP